MKGDFTGFTFVYNGHSYTTDDLGITRVSDGDRYNEPLIPELEDKTIEIPGLDGSYYYGSDFKSRNFPIKIAYDSLNETQFRLMRQVFGVKHTGLLILDEAPYKQYRVKIASPPELDFVCFDERKRKYGEVREDATLIDNTRDIVPRPEAFSTEVIIPVDESMLEVDIEPNVEEVQLIWNEEPLGTEYWEYNVETGHLFIHDFPQQAEETTITVTGTITVYERIYKGEGTIEFVAYYPFATQQFKTLDEYRRAVDEEGNFLYTNVDEWAEGSRIITQDEYEEAGYDKLITSQETGKTTLTVYNAGDISTGMFIYISFVKTTESAEPSDEPAEIEYVDTPFSGGNFTIINTSVITSIYNTHPSLTVRQDLKRQGSDVGLLINMMNGLAEGVIGVSFDEHGYLQYTTSGNLYNEFIDGSFFKIEPGESSLEVVNAPETDMRVFYNYLYF